MDNLELNLIGELKAVRKAGEDMLKADSITFKDNEKFLQMAQKACYHAFYEVVCRAIDDYDQKKQEELDEYENYILGGNQ